jgi:hypothetical protein
LDVLLGSVLISWKSFVQDASNMLNIIATDEIL